MRVVDMNGADVAEKYEMRRGASCSVRNCYLPEGSHQNENYSATS
jgi:hypothetical protein